MVRRRSTVRFRNEAPAQTNYSNNRTSLGGHSGGQMDPVPAETTIAQAYPFPYAELCSSDGFLTELLDGAENRRRARWKGRAGAGHLGDVAPCRAACSRRTAAAGAGFPIDRHPHLECSKMIGPPDALRLGQNVGPRSALMSAQLRLVLRVPPKIPLLAGPTTSAAGNLVRAGVSRMVSTAGLRACAVVRCAGIGRPRLLVSGFLAGGRQRGSSSVTMAGGGETPTSPLRVCMTARPFGSCSAQARSARRR